MPRAIRLQEFAPSSIIRYTPPDWYSADSSLERRQYLLRTDENGFILSGPEPVNSTKNLIILGDSTVEGMFLDEDARFCSKLEAQIVETLGISVRVLNGGYSGATSLHLYNTFINKIIPLHPIGVVLISGFVDTQVAMKKASFWTSDCWLEPIVNFDKQNITPDEDLLADPVYSDREKLLTMFQLASSLFEIPVWYATIPHRQVFQGDFVAKTFIDRSAFNKEVASRRLFNACTRKFALQRGLKLFDLEIAMIGLHEIYYDMVHFNSKAGDIVVRHLLRAGLEAAIKERLGTST